MHGEVSKGATSIKSQVMPVHGFARQIARTYSLQGRIENESRQSQGDTGNATIHKCNRGEVFPGTHRLLQKDHQKLRQSIIPTGQINMQRRTVQIGERTG